MPDKILIVDDEEGVVSLLKDYFEINGYDILIARNGIQAIKQSEKQPDIILLDINMPDLNGLEVCKRIRNYVSCPILFLTAKIDDADKINGFSAGGDDYIVKPFSIDALGARVSAHIRRDKRQAVNNKVKFEDEMVIDYSAKSVYYKGEVIPLVKKEFEIVEFLSTNSGQVFDKEIIYERLWGWDSEGDSSVVTEHVRRIRAKLISAGSKDHIETVWGMGYKWVR